MRLYYSGPSPESLRRARDHAPSHTHGACWTPQKMTPHDVPYFIDNGAFTDDFDCGTWLDTLDRARERMPSDPEFVVYPDVLGDADGTWRRYYDLMHDLGHRELRFLFTFNRYYAIQPGRSLDQQFDTAKDAGAAGVFVGGPVRWKRAYGGQIVELAHNHGLRAHVGNPSGEDGLVWAYRAGFDSCDTTTVLQNGYWHYLEKLEQVTGETHTPQADTSQTTFTDGGQLLVGEEVGGDSV